MCECRACGRYRRGYCQHEKTENASHKNLPKFHGSIYSCSCEYLRDSSRFNRGSNFVWIIAALPAVAPIMLSSSRRLIELEPSVSAIASPSQGAVSPAPILHEPRCPASIVTLISMAFVELPPSAQALYNDDVNYYGPGSHGCSRAKPQQVSFSLHCAVRKRGASHECTGLCAWWRWPRRRRAWGLRRVAWGLGRLARRILGTLGVGRRSLLLRRQHVLPLGHWRRQYETVVPPVGIQDEAGGQGPAASDLIAYPKDGQSAEQLGKDKFECHRWAVGQTGFDPTQAACLEGRGYSVK